MKGKIKILSFGHIPSWAGGKQETGLANVIFQLAHKMAAEDQDVFEVRLVATDMHSDSDAFAPLYIYGWTKPLLIRHILRYPLQALRLLLHLRRCRQTYGEVVHVKRMFLKAIFLRHCIDHFHPDVLHLHGANNIVYFPLIPKRVKIIMTRHGKVGGDSNVSHSNMYSLFERDCCRSNRIAKLYFITSRLIADYEADYGRISAPTEVILNAYDEEIFKYIPHQPGTLPTLMTIASLSTLKGQERVLEGIAASGVACQYVCVGSDNYDINERMLRYAEKHNINYTYVGTKSPCEIRQLLSCADFMILPSSSEGFGLVYVESIACGVPVVLPRNLPIVEEKGIIRPMENAVLLDDSSAESIAHFVRNMSSLAFDHKQVAATVLTYSWKNIARQYLNSIKQLI